MIDVAEAISDIEEGHNRKKCADVLERAYDQLGDLLNKCSDDREDFCGAIDILTTVHRKWSI